MRQTLFPSFLIGLIICLHTHLFAQREDAFPWIVYYNNQASTDAFEPYNPIVFEVYTHPELRPLLDKKKVVLGYVNLGEVDRPTPQFAKAKRAGLMIADNPDWPESVLVDIRKPAWKKMLMEEIIPDIFEKGFVGLFFDQLDVSLALEKEDPEYYGGMADAAIDLIKTIRRTFPDKILMLNRAYEILPAVGNDIDYELAETLYSQYDFKTEKYFVRSNEDYEWQLNKLNQAKKQFPHLVLFSLDYWDPSDKEMYVKIYSIERAHGLRPYVSTIELNRIIPEPS